MSQIVRITDDEIYVRFEDGGTLKLPVSIFDDNYYVGQNVIVESNGSTIFLKKASWLTRILHRFTTK
jgi:hypothetical protein